MLFLFWLLKYGPLDFLGKIKLYANKHNFVSFLPIYIHFSFISYFHNKTYKAIFIMKGNNGHPSLVLALCLQYFYSLNVSWGFNVSINIQKIILLFSVLLGMVINISKFFSQQRKYCIVWIIYSEAIFAFLSKILTGDIMEFAYNISSFYLLVIP